MSIPISQLLHEQPTNDAHYTGLTTGTDKKWVKEYHPITKVHIHTYNDENATTMYANWDAFLPLCADDVVRMSVVGSRPNVRRYRLDTEEDCAIWFHTEISNVVLPAWSGHPDVLQTNQPKPREPNSQVTQMVDVVYALTHRKLHHMPLAIP